MTFYKNHSKLQKPAEMHYIMQILVLISYSVISNIKTFNSTQNSFFDKEQTLFFELQFHNWLMN